MFTGTNLYWDYVGDSGRRIIQLLRRFQLPRLVKTVVGGVNAGTFKIARRGRT